MYMKMKRLVATIFLATTLGGGVFAQSITQSLNDGWSFSDNQVKWKAVALPHTWNTDAYETSAYKQGKCSYKRILRLPIETNKRYFLKLEAANKTSTIYINGKKVGEHRGGYTASVADLTPFLRRAKSLDDCSNEILITVDNADRHVAPISADFTFMGGIYRNVKLITTNLQHFSMTEDGSDGVFVSTQHVSADKADINVRCRLRNDDAQDKDCYLVHTLYAPDGKIVSTVKKTVRLKANQTQICQTAFPQIKSPVLWSPENPMLYRVKTILLEGKKLRVKDVDRQSRILDSQEHYVGLRWCEFNAEKGFFLNGKPYKLNGMCRHQDWRPYGVALEDDMHRKDLRMLKDMGCNFIRLAHYPQAEAVLEMCDKLGMLVWEEIPVVNYVPDDEEFADNAACNLREMIRQHYNHPSVILWGYMNEILLKARNEYPKQDDFDKEIARIQALASRLEKIIHEEDATRHSTMALHGSDDYNKYHIADYSQVLGWNLYQGWYGGDLTGFERYLADQHKNHPTHPVIVSEWGAGSDLRIHTYEGKPFDFSCEYQQKYIEHYLPVISDTPYILGGSYWNFVDFSSANRGESMPHINNKGVVTPERRKKDVFYYFQAAWRKDVPVLHIATRDWQERETVDAHHSVKVYTNASEVTLLQNGKMVGKKLVNNHFALFDVDLQEGDNRLEARTTDDRDDVRDLGRQVVDQTVVTYKPVPLDAKKIDDIAINVGSHCYFQSAKTSVTWVADRAYTEGSWGYIGGKPSTTQTKIECTEDGPLYQTMMDGIEGYRLDVPQGRYELELLFADTRKKQAQSIYLLGKDKEQGDAQGAGGGFAVEVNGKVLEPNLKPGIEAGYFTAMRRSYLVECGTEGLEVRFSAYGNGKAFLSGIRLRKL